MKNIVKKIYMLIWHPVLFFKFTVRNGFMIRRRADIRHIKKIRMGNRVSFGSDTRINFYDGSEEVKLIIGDGCYFCNRDTILAGEEIAIGKNVLVASDVLIVSENHGIDPEDDVPYMHQSLLFSKVSIGDGTWIGEKAVILPGVSIGKKCVIGAGAIVTKDIPDLSMAAGNPAKVIKKYNSQLKLWERAGGGKLILWTAANIKYVS